MEEEAGSGILAGECTSNSQLNALLKIYILKQCSEMYIAHVYKFLILGMSLLQLL